MVLDYCIFILKYWDRSKLILPPSPFFKFKALQVTANKVKWLLIKYNYFVLMIKILKQLSKMLTKFHINPWREDLWRQICLLWITLSLYGKPIIIRKYFKAVLCYKIRVLHFNLYLINSEHILVKVFIKFQGRIWFRIKFWKL